MRQTKASLTLSLLCLLVPAFVQGYWDFPLADPPQYGVEDGSALCAGIGTEEDGIPRNSVWFLQNGWYGADYFCRYGISEGTWRRWFQPPIYPIGPGGALAYVRDINACPENGWIFAFKGNETRDFWVFFPSNSSWERAPDVPEPVIEGGALCYGGNIDIGGTPYVVLYAFTGQHHEDAVGNWHGHFWRYYFRNLPTKGHSPPVNGTWEPLADIPGKIKGYHPALTWVPMNDPLRYPNGVVVAIKNNLDRQGYIYLYYPQQNQWFDVCPIPDPTSPGNYARLGDGACMTSHYRDSTMFLPGNTLKRYYGFYDVESNTVHLASPTPQDVDEGAAITALRWEGIAYAEFGRQDRYPNPGFGRWIPPPYQEGSQGTGKNSPGRITAVLHQNQTSHIFSVTCSPGPVQLSIMDVTGRRLACLAQECQGKNVDIFWNHPTIASGVYLWIVSTPSGVADGKLVIAK